MSATGLREVRFVGPTIASPAHGDQPLYLLTCQLLYTPQPQDDLVDRNHGLRTTALDQEIEDVDILQHDDLDSVLVQRSVLLRARIDGEPDTDRRYVFLQPPLQEVIGPAEEGGGQAGGGGGGLGAQDARVVLLPPEDRGVIDVLARPYSSWPPSRLDEHGLRQIYVPPFHLAAGGVDVRVDPFNGIPSAFGYFLNNTADRSRVLGGLELTSPPAGEAGATVTLVPEGIEIDVVLPNPLALLIEGQDETIKARIRIEPSTDPVRFTARLVGPTTGEEDDSLRPLVKALGKVFDALEVAQSPLRLAYDDRSMFPPLLWHLRYENSQLHFFWNGCWRVELDPKVTTLRAETDKGLASKRAAVARFQTGDGASLRFVQTDTNDVKLQYSSGEPREADLSVTYSRAADDADFVTSKIEANELSSYLPVHEAMSREAAKLGTDQEDLQAFLPTRDGVLHLMDLSDTDSAPDDLDAKSAFEGNLVFRITDRAAREKAARASTPGGKNADTSGKVIEIDDAEAAGISVTWASKKVREITIEVAAPTGGLRRAVWLAREAPKPSRLLPTGRRDPSHTLELVPVFGGTRSPNASLTLSLKETGVFTWNLKTFDGDGAVSGSAVDWRRSRDLPLISAMPMLSAKISDNDPGALRNLFPATLDAAAGWELSGDDSAAPPALAGEEYAPPNGVNWPWPDTSKTDWARLSVPFVNPTAPGLEYDLSAGGGATPKVSLRYDLPILDEFFAGLSGEDEAKPGEATAANGSPIPSDGVRDANILTRFWTEQSVRLGFTRTQRARASGWTDLQRPEADTSTPGPLKFIGNHDAAATLRFGSSYILSKPGNGTVTPVDVNLGNFSVHWVGEEDPITFFGPKALLGISGSFAIDENDKVVKGAEGDIDVQGFAAALFTGASGLKTDALGTGLNGSPEISDTSADRGVATKDSAMRLHTMHKPADIVLQNPAGGQVALKFWCRDLPLSEEGVFSAAGNPVEGALGPNPDVFDAGNAIRSLYEWRLAADKGTGPKTYHYDLGDLRYVPLRLIEFKPDESLKLLCRVGPVPRQENAGNTPFTDDKPYETGPLVQFDLVYDPAGKHFGVAEPAPGEPAPIRKMLSTGAEQLALEDAGDDDMRVSFRLRAKLNCKIGAFLPGGEAGSAETISVVLSGKLSSAGALVNTEIEFRLLRNDVKLTGADTPPDGVVFHHTGPVGKSDGFVISRAQLRLESSGSADAMLDVELVGGLPVDDRGDGAPASFGVKRNAENGEADYSYRWLGLEIDAPDRVVFDHERGALGFSFTQKPGTIAAGTPFQGLLSDPSTCSLRLDASLVLVPDGEKAWSVESGQVNAGFHDHDDDMPLTLTAFTERGRPESDDPVGEPVGESRTRSKLRLSREVKKEGDEGYLQSGIHWDPNAVTLNGDTAPILTDHVALSTTASGNGWTHSVRTVLRNHGIDTRLLAQSGEGVRLVKELPVTLLVTHLLSRADGAERREWNAVEYAVLTSPRLWLEGMLGSDNADPAVFGPRYMQTAARYRGSSDHSVIVGGVGPRRDMLSGFDDPLICDALQRDGNLLGSDETLILLGGAPSLSQTGGDPATLFVLPWVTRLTGETLPAPFDNLMRFSPDPVDWRAARFDATVTQLDRTPEAAMVHVPEGAYAEDQIQAVLAGATQAAQDQGNAVRSAAERLVEQSFVEAVDAAAMSDLSRVPIFLHALQSLGAFLARTSAEPDRLAVLTVHPLKRGHAEQIVICKADPIVAQLPLPPRTPAVAYYILTHGRDGRNWSREIDVSELRIETGVSYGSQADVTDFLNAVDRALQTVMDNLGEPRLREMAENFTVPPDAAILLAEDGDGAPLALKFLTLAAGFQEFGEPDTELTPEDQDVYPSPALGWPSLPGGHDADIGDSATHGLIERDDRPIVSGEAGLSARSSLFSLSGRSDKLRATGNARYLASQARALFHHGSKAAKFRFAGAAAGHLMPLASRLRVPGEEARRQALKEAGAPDLDQTISLMPLAYNRSLIGERPGSIETMVDAVLVGGDATTANLDVGEARFGDAGMTGSVVMRQSRIPRSPKLPVGKTRDESRDLTRRRRTYVSLADEKEAGVPGDRLRTHMIRPWPASFWRVGKSGDGLPAARIVLELHDPVLKEDEIGETLEVGRNIKLRLRARIQPDLQGAELGDGQALHLLVRSGLLRLVNKKPVLNAWLTFGPDRVYASELVRGEPETQKETGETFVDMHLEFSAEHGDFILQELAADDPSRMVALNFTMLGDANAIEKPPMKFELNQDLEGYLHGLPRAISLPMGRKPAFRETLDVQSRSCLFADAAFDRILSTPAGQSNLASVKGKKWLLATDRTQYEAGGTIYFAFGSLNEDNTFGAEGQALTLELTLTPPAGDTEPSEEEKIGLMISGLGEVELKSSKPYMLPLGMLKDKENPGRPLPMVPGANLRLDLYGNVDGEEVKLFYSFTISDRVENPTPAAVYSVENLVGDLDNEARPDVILHASSPRPARFEFNDLIGDLAKGNVRRQAYFEWRHTDFSQGSDLPWHIALIKTDRAGGAQQPEHTTDFEKSVEEDPAPGL